MVYLKTRTDVKSQNREKYSRGILDHRKKENCPPKPLPYPRSKFSHLPLRAKVEILYLLHEYHLSANDVNEMIKGLEADGLRVQPVGYDGNGNAYWYFYGTRLYMEQPLLAHAQIKHSNNEQHGFQKKMKHKKKKHQARKTCYYRERDDSPEVSNRYMTKKVMKTQWTLVCSTSDDWEALTIKFKRSKIACEKKLYSVLENEYLPEIKNIFSSQEESSGQKSCEDQPRRMSLRLGRIYPKIQDQESIAALTEEAEHKTRKDRKDRLQEEEEEERETQQCMRRAQRLEERHRIVEDQQRSLRLRRHTLAQSLEEDAQNKPELSTQNSNASNSGFSDDGEDLEELNQRIQKVLIAVNGHKDSWPFLQPVDEAYAPGYFDWIKEPMDLSTMDQKVQNQEYHTTDEFVRDFKKMVNNCEIYNGPNHAFTQFARILWRIFRKAVRRHLFHDVGGEECVFMHEQGPSESRENVMTIGSYGNKKQRRAANVMKKKKKKKKRRRPPGMKAIEALAQAAEQALRDAASRSSFDNSSPCTNFPDEFSMTAFPNLKISTTQSHPASLLAKYFGLGRSENTQGEDATVSSTTSTPEKIHTIGAISCTSDLTSELHLTESEALAAKDNTHKPVNEEIVTCDKNDEKRDVSVPPVNHSMENNSREDCIERISDTEENHISLSSSSHSDFTDSSESSDESCHAQYTIVPLDGKLGSFQIKKVLQPSLTQISNASEISSQRLSPDSVLSPASCAETSSSSVFTSIQSNAFGSSALSPLTGFNWRNRPDDDVSLGGVNTNSLKTSGVANAELTYPKEAPFPPCLQLQLPPVCNDLDDTSQHSTDSIPETEVWSEKGEVILNKVLCKTSESTVSESDLYRVQKEYMCHRLTESTIPVKKRFYFPTSFESFIPRSTSSDSMKQSPLSVLDKHSMNHVTPTANVASSLLAAKPSGDALTISEENAPAQVSTESSELVGERERSLPAVDDSEKYVCEESSGKVASEKMDGREDMSGVYNFNSYAENSSKEIGPLNDYRVYTNYFNPLFYRSYLNKDVSYAHNLNLQFTNNYQFYKDKHDSLRVSGDREEEDGREAEETPRDVANLYDCSNVCSDQRQLDGLPSNYGFSCFPRRDDGVFSLNSGSKYGLTYGPRTYVPSTKSHLSDFVSHILKNNFPSEPSSSSQEEVMVDDESIPASLSSSRSQFWKSSRFNETETNALSSPKEHLSPVSQASPEPSEDDYSPSQGATSFSATTCPALGNPSFAQSSTNPASYQLHSALSFLTSSESNQNQSRESGQ